MAKLSAHGAELYRVEHAHCRVAYIADGKILRDTGSGWKLWRSCKPGVDPVQHAEQKRRFYAEVPLERQMRAAFRERMVEEFPCLETRNKIFHMIDLMPSDPDGVWSTCDDYRIETPDLDTLVELCRLYESADRESRAARAELSTLKPLNSQLNL